jgi:hypothetical protein
MNTRRSSRASCISPRPLGEPDDGIVEIARVPRSVARSFGRHSRRSRGRR